MPYPHRRAAILVSLFFVVLVPTARGGDWLAFRGSNQDGASATEFHLPERFDGESNVAWRVPLPGSGPSSPIVVGDLVVVTAATGPRQDRLHVLAFNTEDGRQRWNRQFWATGHTATDDFGGVAANTPVSDGRSIVAMFSTNDVVCLDLDGNPRWFRGLAYDDPNVRNDVGMASSPVIVGDVVVVQCDNQGKSLAAGLDLATGATRWRIDRPAGAIWSSPVVLRGLPGDAPIVLLTGRDGLSGVDPATGRRLFLFPADMNTIASAAVRERDIFVDARGLYRLRYDPLSRDVEPLWHSTRLMGGNPSPTVAGERVYVVKSPGILMSADAETGEILWQTRLSGRQFWATPVVADGKAFVVPHEGRVQVVALDRGEILGESAMEDGCLATPAIAGDAIYFRTNQALWKVRALEP